MYLLQERRFMIDPIRVISWGIQILQYLFSTENEINFLLSTETIIFGLIKKHISIEYKHTPGYLLLQQDPERNIHNSDFLDLIPC